MLSIGWPSYDGHCSPVRGVASKKAFSISRESITSVRVVYLEIHADGAVGRGEAVGVDYRGETPELLKRQIEGYFAGRKTLSTREKLEKQLLAGGARNAIDCALWDLEAKQAGVSVWKLAGLSSEPAAQRVCFTLSLAPPEAMAAASGRAPQNAALKLKLGGRDGRDLERILTVREAAPHADIVVDFNEAWTREALDENADTCAALGVSLIEQPVPRQRDYELDGYSGPVPLCADESFYDIPDLKSVVGRYKYVNIKLDKTGGLTPARAAANAARAEGLKLFAGCMLGTSLSMAPAFHLAQQCAYVDLDGPLLLARDRANGFAFDGAYIQPADSRLWG